MLLAPTWGAELANAYATTRVGDDVTRTADYDYGRRNPIVSRHTVAKITRQSIIILVHGREQKFDIATGIERRSVNAIGGVDRLDNLATEAQRARRKTLLEALDRYGLQFKGRGYQGLDAPGNDVLAEILAMCDRRAVPE